MAQSLTLKAVLDLFGPKTCDIHLNDTAYWTNVPEQVWEFYIGGYQVIKKRLSCRERPLLGRPRSDIEARHNTTVARRLAALRLIQPALDRRYQSSKS